MAITRAQQVKQLLKEGGRTGFFLGSSANTYTSPSREESRSRTDRAQAAAAREAAASNQGNNDYTYRGPADLGVTTRTKDRVSPPAAYTYIGGDKIDVIPENRDYREELERQQLVKRQKEIDDFVNAPPKQIKTPFPIMTTGLNVAQKFLPYKVTRKFYADDVVGRTVTLPDGRTITFDYDNYDEYDQLRKQGIINPYGRVLTDAERGIGRDDGPDPIIPIIPQDPLTMDQATEELIEEEEEPFQRALAFRADGGRVGAMGGGIMNADMIGGMMDGNMDEMGRQMYGLGKLVKKATRAVKKIAKSPIGKAALLYTGAGALSNLAAGSGLGAMFTGFTSPKSFLAKEGLRNIFTREGLGNIFLGKAGFYDKVGAVRPGSGVFTKATSGLLGKGGELGFGKVATLASVLPFFGLGTGDETEEEAARLLDNSGFDLDEVRKSIQNAGTAADRRMLSARADGGLMRLGYQEGGDAEPVAKKTMPLLDMGGKEKDYRETGGFVDMGRMERADDVPARLSKNEFVFTADAVRNAGDGNIDKGAEVMYNMMKNLENGGDVSEESQGLEGARKMFQTSQRLEEVL